MVTFTIKARVEDLMKIIGNSKRISGNTVDREPGEARSGNRFGY